MLGKTAESEETPYAEQRSEGPVPWHKGRGAMELTLAMRGQAAKSCERPGEDQRSRAIEYAKCATSRGSYSRNLTPGSFLLCKAARVSHQLTVRVLGQAISRAKSKNASDSGNLTPGPFPEKEGVFEDDYQKKTLFSA